MHIVVADDDASQRVFLSTILRRIGHQVDLAEDGRQALTALRTGKAAMLICDVDMPEMDGMELARQVRQADLDRYVYVLMVTGLGSSDDRMRGLEAGADDFMSKPVDTAILFARIRAAERIIRYEQDLHLKNQRLEEAYRLIQDDLAAAAEAQKSLLPPAQMRLSQCLFTSALLPSRGVSGDVFAQFELAPGRLVTYAADVCGHGVRSAFQAMALGRMASQEFFRGLLAQPDRGPPHPEKVVKVLDRRFSMQASDATYFTLFVGIIDEDEDRLSFCQAGYPGPLLVRAAGDATFLGMGGMPVALVPEAEFDTEVTPFRAGDRLVIHSDGVTEAQNPEGELFGRERLAAFFAERRGRPPDQIIAELASRLANWSGSPAPADDVSLIIIDREPNP